ncbi:MAG: hypothetical protein M1819_001271 [Sarea resinae]|nr:MAG: hypothetical protein M1819_001271 [Sarea resinae]
MAASRAIAKLGDCQSCRLAIVRSFISVAVVPGRPASHLQRTKNESVLHSRRTGSGPSRSFSTISSLHTDQVRKSLDASNLEAEEVEDAPAAEAKSSEPAEASDHVPWYLKAGSQQQDYNPVSERQRLPKIPSNPPAILQPLLEHISVDLGLDDLSLFDLRKLDPPPALGANLLMIIGTARSERHLHVSADRLCRWLRTTYKLSPFADGLLGRNELKLKLRRKARRAKLLGSVGASDGGNADDGLRTGWVCVNVGRVEGGMDPEEAVQEQDFVGFGTRTDGVRVVVQMLTDDKRGELDLESLWAGFLRRKAKEDATRGTEDEAVDDAFLAEVSASEKSTRPLSTAPPQSHVTYKPLQTRGFHTSSRFGALETDSQSDTGYDESSLPSVEPRIQYSKNAEQSIASRNLMPPGGVSSEHHGHQPTLEDKTHILTLRALLGHLRRLPKPDALEVLGQGPSDTSSTSFLQSFYSALPPVSDPAHGTFKLLLYARAVQLKHPGYTKKGLLSLFEENRIIGGAIDDQVSQAVLHSILRSASPKTVHKDIDLALQVFTDRVYRGFPLITSDIYVQLNETARILCPSNPAPNSTDPSPVSPLYPRLPVDHILSVSTSHTTPSTPQTRLHLIWTLLSPPLPSPHNLNRLLSIYATTNHWALFWDVWNSIARSGVPRSEDLYHSLFTLVAKTKHPRGVAAVLRRCVPAMQEESPPVPVAGKVAAAVRECVEVVEPRVREMDQEREGGEWARLWRRCCDGR